MDAYMFKAALLCVDCGEKVIAKIGKQADTGDSDDFPQGPYAKGGGEADTPQHCDRCGVFLKNRLTSDGLDYVVMAITEECEADRRDSVACTEWAEFYGVEVPA